VNARENRIRAYRFQCPDWIPVTAGIAPLAWDYYAPDALEDLMLDHPLLFPAIEHGSARPDKARIPPDMIAGAPYTDGWGCVWETLHTGMVGCVRKRPLASWGGLDALSTPDPDRHDGMYALDWAGIRDGVRRAHARDEFVALGLPHGHTFLRLQDLRGYQNLICDMAEERPELKELIARVERFNVALIERRLALEPDMISLPEDLGMQQSPMLSPEMFRTYIQPSYARLMGMVRAQGVLVHQHSDGYILDLLDGILECGCDVVNLQDLVNGIDNIRDALKGRAAIDLDVDRQSVTVFGSPDDIDDLIDEAVEKLGSESGGLSLCYQPWPPTPLENIRAVCDAMERCSGAYA